MTPVKPTQSESVLTGLACPAPQGVVLPNYLARQFLQILPKKTDLAYPNEGGYLIIFPISPPSRRANEGEVGKERPHGSLRVNLGRAMGAESVGGGASTQPKAAANSRDTPSLANSRRPQGNVSHGGFLACPCPILAGRAPPGHSHG